MAPMNEERRERTAAEMAIRELRLILGLIKVNAPTVEIMGSITGAIRATEALLNARILEPEQVYDGNVVYDLAARYMREGKS